VPFAKMYLGFIFLTISSAGGEAVVPRSGEGSTTVEKFVTLAGQTCDMRMSTREDELAEDIIEEIEELLDVTFATELDKSLETVCEEK